MPSGSGAKNTVFYAGVPANSAVLDGNSEFSWVATAGTHTIGFAVDVDNHVLESNESNNSRFVTVTVTSQTRSEHVLRAARATDVALPKYKEKALDILDIHQCLKAQPIATDTPGEITCSDIVIALTVLTLDRLRSVLVLES